MLLPASVKDFPDSSSRTCNPIAAPVRTCYHTNSHMQLLSTYLAMAMPMYHEPAGCSPTGCQQHLPAPFLGCDAKKDSMKITWCGHFASAPLSCCQNLGKNQPAAEIALAAGHGITETFGSRTKVPTGSTSKPPTWHGQTYWTPLSSCQLRSELLLRLKFPPSPCLHSSTGGFGSSKTLIKGHSSLEEEEE